MSEHDDPRLSRRALFDLVWAKPMTAIAAELGTKDYHVRALCTRLALPVPVNGHWMKAQVGKAPATPPYPADARLDAGEHIITRHAPRAARAAGDNARSSPDAIMPAAQIPRPPGTQHKLLRATRAALAKPSKGMRVGCGGSGKFRLLVAPGSTERAFDLLDLLLHMIEARGWTVDDSAQGYRFVPDGEPIGFSIEEKLDSKPHVRTPPEQREFTEYERKCALADRGIGYRPWRPPAIPTHDYEPNGQLVLKLDDGLPVEGLRRTFSDGKRQRLEDLLPAILNSLDAWAKGKKEWRLKQERWRQEARDEEERRRAAENIARTDGYRLAFLRRQCERLDEIERIEQLLTRWDRESETHPSLCELIAWARAHCADQRALLEPGAVAERIERLRLMEQKVHIFDTAKLS